MNILGNEPHSTPDDSYSLAALRDFKEAFSATQKAFRRQNGKFEVQIAFFNLSSGKIYDLLLESHLNLLGSNTLKVFVYDEFLFLLMDESTTNPKNHLNVRGS